MSEDQRRTTIKRRICGILVVTQLMGLWLIAAAAGTPTTNQQCCAIEARTSSIAPARTVRTSTNPVVAVLPRSLDFASVAVGRTRNLTFTVQNVGAGTLTGVAEVSAPFRIVGGSPYVLQHSQSQVITVQYLPKTTGMNLTVVRLTGGGTASVTVAGSAFPAPRAAPPPPLTLRLLAALRTCYIKTLPLFSNSGSLLRDDGGVASESLELAAP